MRDSSGILQYLKYKILENTHKGCRSYGLVWRFWGEPFMVFTNIDTQLFNFCQNIKTVRIVQMDYVIIKN